MRVRILLFSQMRIEAERSTEELEVAEGATVGDALTQFYSRHPALQGFAPSCLVAVGLEYAPPGHPLSEGDEISLIPPVSGG